MPKMWPLFLTINWDAVAALGTLFTGILAFWAAMKSARAAEGSIQAAETSAKASKQSAEAANHIVEIERIRLGKEARNYSITAAPIMKQNPYLFNNSFIPHVSIRIVNHSIMKLIIPRLTLGIMEGSTSKIITHELNLSIDPMEAFYSEKQVNIEELLQMGSEIIYVKALGLKNEIELELEIPVSEFKEDTSFFLSKTVKES